MAKKLPVYLGESKATLLDEMPPKGTFPMSLSVSKSKTFANCKASFKFNYILKFPKKEKDYLVLGSFVHNVLEDFHKLQLSGNSDPDHISMNYCFKESKNDYRDKLSVEQKKQSFSYLTDYLSLMNNQKRAGIYPTILSAEEDFYVNLDNKAVLVGFIDRVQTDVDGVLHVADYKTSKTDQYLKKDLFQLKVYGYIMCLKDPSLKKVRCSYIMIKLGFSYITVEFSREELMAVELELLKYVKLIQEETEYKTNTSPLCTYCDFLEHCKDGIRFSEMWEERKKSKVEKSKHGKIDW